MFFVVAWLGVDALETPPRTRVLCMKKILELGGLLFTRLRPSNKLTHYWFIFIIFGPEIYFVFLQSNIHPSVHPSINQSINQSITK
jgi:hypothetical protein